MLGLLVVTHGSLAEELVRATKTIVGPTDALEGVSIGWDDDVTDAQRRIEQSVERLGKGGGADLLADGCAEGGERLNVGAIQLV